ncbi:MAG: PHP domain-containing protein [Lentisphaerae bacterium]|nr:PHP domain-containing protein [Lentisphaerota bacterium]
MIDLHAHSTFSDGSLTPAELVAEGRRMGLSALALTDHDNMAGIDPFLEAGREQIPGSEMECIPGVEISAEVPKGTMHVLGYFMDHTDPELNRSLAMIRGGREERNDRIIERLRELGLELTREEIAAYAGEDVLGRPHIAQAMMARGYVSTFKAAFDQYLAKGKPGYVDRLRLTPEESVQAIRLAGGVAVLSHPFTLEQGPDDLKRRLAELRDAGLQGVETYYSEHSAAQVSEYLALASSLGLIPTGGSDFHGEINPKVRLGIGFGSLRVPDDVVAQLRSALAEREGAG